MRAVTVAIRYLALFGVLLSVYGVLSPFWTDAYARVQGLFILGGVLDYIVFCKADSTLKEIDAQKAREVRRVHS